VRVPERLRVIAANALVSAGVLAVDGSKFPADASDSAIRTYEQIAAEILQEADALDAAEEDIHGPARGNSGPLAIPAICRERSSRNPATCDPVQVCATASLQRSAHASPRDHERRPSSVSGVSTSMPEQRWPHSIGKAPMRLRTSRAPTSPSSAAMSSK
jgi:hypothetical protein